MKRRVPSCERAAWVSEGANRRSEPGKRRSSSAAQARCSPGRLDRDHRGALDAAASDQAAEPLDTVAEHWQRQRRFDQSPLTGRQPDPIRHLAGVDRHCQRPLVKRAAKYGTRHKSNLLK